MDNQTDTIQNQLLRTNLNLPGRRTGLKANSKATGIMLAEGSENLYTYVDWLGLINDRNLVVLSSMHHYYFDHDDLKNVKTIINLKHLNQIKNIGSFFHMINKMIPAKSNFIGSFFDSKKQNWFATDNISSQYHRPQKVDPYENGITSRVPFLNMIYNFLDSKTDKYLTEKSVRLLLADQGFYVLDMTEFNGITFFHAQKSNLYKNS